MGAYVWLIAVFYAFCGIVAWLFGGRGLVICYCGVGWFDGCLFGLLLRVLLLAWVYYGWYAIVCVYGTCLRCL